MTSGPLQGRVALVTGASRGIGAAIATTLADAGADLAITARDVASLRESAAQIVAMGRRCLPVACEVTNAESVDDAVTQVETVLGPVDILVNNAGVNIPRLALEATEAQWDTILDTNLKGAFLCAQRVGRTMVDRRSGRIVNISSAAGLIPALERVAYCSSKAGLIMLTRVLALEWAQYGITVNAVAPTFVETELAAQTLNRPGVREYWERTIPLGRLATTADVAAAVRYLVSPEASFITGEVLSVDGGLAMR
ncbi:MAG: glucose 1-dehydrogenase [Chloroflexia bacterium]|nr:glucose 1-dehydrogenase [Chloroflexia bacterium]